MPTRPAVLLTIAFPLLILSGCKPSNSETKNVERPAENKPSSKPIEQIEMDDLGILKTMLKIVEDVAKWGAPDQRKLAALYVKIKDEKIRETAGRVSQLSDVAESLDNIRKTSFAERERQARLKLAKADREVAETQKLMEQVSNTIWARSTSRNEIKRSQDAYAHYVRLSDEILPAKQKAATEALYELSLSSMLRDKLQKQVDEGVVSIRAEISVLEAAQNPNTSTQTTK